MFAAVRQLLAGLRPDRPVTSVRRRVVPGFEVLEDRRTPASYVVNWMGENPPPMGQWLTLRQAIGLANNSGDGDNSITFQSGMSGTITLTSALPTITANMSISGPGGIQIARDAAAPAFRIFTIQGAIQVDLSYLTIGGGRADFGGGIYVPEGATATLYSVNVFNNTATRNGGGIYNFGTVNIGNCHVDTNHAGDARGGGIFNNGSLSIEFNSTVNGNSARWEGGGIYNDQEGSATISDSTIAMNGAGELGAVDQFGWGGGIYNRGILVMSSSTLSGNGAVRQGGGLFCSGGSSATLTSVTITNNSARNPAFPGRGAAGQGGGFFVSGFATLSCTDCTLSGNQADDPASRGGFVMQGGNYTWNGLPAQDPVFIGLA